MAGVVDTLWKFEDLYDGVFVRSGDGVSDSSVPAAFFKLIEMSAGSLDTSLTIRML
jgi:hypothetical protein